jgi:hypothetical protein
VRESERRSITDTLRADFRFAKPGQPTEPYPEYRKESCNRPRGSTRDRPAVPVKALPSPNADRWLTAAIPFVHKIDNTERYRLVELCEAA